MSRLAALCALCLLPAAAARAHDVTPEDYFSLAGVTDLAVSPDGKRVAYCEARWDKKANDRKADLWLVATDGKGKPVRLTSDRANERHPRWSADGKWIYALANRKRAGEKAPYDGKAQVWRVSAGGGEPKPVTRAEGGVVLFDLGGRALYYSVDAKKSDEDFAPLRKEFDKLQYGHGVRTVSEVWRVDLETWREKKVVAEQKYVRELACTRDGKRLAMITANDDSVVESEGRSRVETWDESGGKVTATDEGWRKTAASKYPWLESLAWAPSGDKLAYVSVFDAYPAEVIVNVWKDGKPEAARVKRAAGEQVLNYGSPLRWSAARGEQYEGRPVFLRERHGKAWRSDRTVEGVSEGVTSLFDLSADGKSVVELIGLPDRFGELYCNGARLTDLNPQVAAEKWKLPTVEHVTWKAPDGSTVGGVLELPPGYKKGARAPLVVGIHGGPTASIKADLEFDFYAARLVFASRGYAVLCPNYRGSTGYGDRFVTDLIGKENDVDVKDILAGIEHLVKKGIADPDRVAVMGWSNGGYLTNCLITLKDPPVKIKAASSGAGILDTVAEWGFNDEPAYPFVFKKGTPWQTPEIYKKTSPTYGLGHVTTPTLIHVGGNDERCPPGHSRMLYRALREYRKVPAELVVYPGEPHGLARYDSRLAKMKWDLAWFDRYVLGKK
jgi:dipeptidyl aminopeptidase/acylaminoacyl peptidase